MTPIVTTQLDTSTDRTPARRQRPRRGRLAGGGDQQPRPVPGRPKAPASRLPPLGPDRCGYLVEWVQVKYRWRLSVDSAERDTLGKWFAAGRRR